MIRVDSAISGEARRASQERMAAWTSWAWETVATLPVPIAQTGSSVRGVLARSEVKRIKDVQAMTIRFQASPSIAPAIASS